MRRSSAGRTGCAPAPRSGGQARVKTLLTVSACVVLGVAVGVLWFRHSATPDSTGSQPVALSEGTKAVLRRLVSPVDIRFYALLDRATVPASLVGFAERADQLLSAFQQEGGGKINVIRHDTLSDANATLAARDGIRAFNRDQGDACYLGLCVVSGEQKELLARLSPEWEQALESDVSRAIERVAASSLTTTPGVALAPRPDASTAEEVKQLIPNLASVSMEEGTRILREIAMNEFKATVNETAVLVKEAQHGLSLARNSGSEAEQQAAMKQLQQIQAQQTEKLTQLADHLQTQIAALEQLKKLAQPPTAAQ